MKKLIAAVLLAVCASNALATDYYPNARPHSWQAKANKSIALSPELDPDDKHIVAGLTMAGAAMTAPVAPVLAGVIFLAGAVTAIVATVESNETN